jgi:23S rRNA (uracil1939-C5)-methyltransferase
MARQRSQNNLVSTPIKTYIESLSHDGRGVAHVDGKAVFIDDALPGEELEFIYSKIYKDYAEARTLTVFKPAAERVKAECPHYGVCGGCSFQHVDSKQQILFKQALLIEQFSRIGKIEVGKLWPPLTDIHWGYRTKARMGVKYVEKKGRVLVGFRERRQPFLAEMDNCKVMHPLIGTNLLALSEMIGQLSIKNLIPQIEVAIGDHNDCVLAFRILKPATESDKIILREFGRRYRISICLQSKGVNTIQPLDGETQLIPSYDLPEQGLRFQFKPTMFTQVNYGINRQMISRVLAEFALTKNDTVLDLFCGLGNFTLPLATKAGRVLGIEGDAALIRQAQENARWNQLNNVEFYLADLTKKLDASWVNQSYTKVLLDPSRAGAAELLPYLKQWNPQQIIYVSCNPSTLARDAGILVNSLGYKLVNAGVMDMFPQTAHVESMALFEK